jgi:hypothetical protein
MRPAVVVGLLLLAALLWAEPDAELRTAQQELKLAKVYLDSVRGSYDGHRRRAIDHVKRATREIKLGLLDAAGAREHGEPHPHAR